MDKKRKTTAILLFLGLLILTLIGFYRGSKYDNRIRSNHIVVCGTIKSVTYSKGNYLKYEFIYNNKTLEEFSSCTLETTKKFNKGKNNILIVFEKGNPKNNSLLESYEDYE